MDELFIICLTAFLSALLAWGFKRLPGENWQFIAAIPVKKETNGSWAGLNLTYYGFFSASACLIATAVLCILLGSIGISPKIMLMMAVCIIGLCMPAARFTARIVEKKKFTFSVQGASFVGILIAPWTIVMLNRLMEANSHTRPDVIVALAAIVTSFALGEGVGRLSCISFGCCYGKPLSQTSPLMQKLFAHLYFIFYGSTKKIAYADGLDGSRIIPVQAITSIVLCLTGVAGTYLFLKGFYVLTFVGVVSITQIWRFLSEFIRADHRGEGKISAYQIMGFLTIFYALAIAWLFPVSAHPEHDIIAGLHTIWKPSVILFLQILWLLTFIYTGRSKVTGATLSFSVIKENI
ncbi:MAG: prolipoprotein diacylglyceryl transferase family protein [Desulfosalsimonadaceae bacterium]